MKPSIRRVHDALLGFGLTPRIVEFAESTRTAQDAAAAIGTSVPRIVKSLVFLADGEPLIVLTSGVNRVDTTRLGRDLGTAISRADADRVRAATGLAVGGVPPLGYPAPLDVVIDRDLLAFDEVWAAAGTPNAVFSIGPQYLVRVSGGRVLDIKVQDS